MPGLTQKVLAEAEGAVPAIFRPAGIEIEFVDRQAQADFRLEILDHRPRDFHGDTTGLAVLLPSDSYAVIFLPLVQAAARDLQAPVAEVLAVSLAHELGHLLLHSAAHASSGIMKPRIDRQQIRLLERGELQFAGNSTGCILWKGKRKR